MADDREGHKEYSRFRHWLFILPIFCLFAFSLYWLFRLAPTAPGKEDLLAAYVAAMVAIFTFAIRYAVQVWVALRERNHLANGLLAYIEDAQVSYQQQLVQFNCDKVECLDDLDVSAYLSHLDSDENYMPYIIFDEGNALTSIELRDRYRFLDGLTMRRVTGYLNDEQYLQAVVSSFRDPLVIGFDKARRAGFIEEYKRAFSEAYLSCECAQQMVSIVAKRGTLEWLMHIVGVPPCYAMDKIERRQL